jgi:putative ABC transport system ATP-binding protein
MLKVENLKYHYIDGDKKREILKGIDYEFDKGKLYAIKGPSGSGKTTFLSLIAGLDVQKEGTIKLNDKDIKDMGLTNYRKEKVSIVFQSYNLINYMTALENIVSAMEISGNTKNKKEIALNKLKEVGLDEIKGSRLINKLSGGEQQRVAIARSIATNPDIILADEPTGNLDNNTETEIVDIFKKLAHDQNKCVIVVTHSNELADQADVLIKLKDGLFVIK